MIKLAPSLLAADFSDLKNNIKAIEDAGAHYLHLDVMDGHFVPNISFGAPVIKSIRQASKMVFDVHLMITNPLKYVEQFAKSGGDIINFHIECDDEPIEVISKIKALGKKAAITVKPATNIEEIYKYLHLLDMVLIMSVEPGFGGAEFLPEMLNKSLKLADYKANNNLIFDIEMDGGIYLHNAKDVVNAGVNVVVAGTAVFGAQSIKQSVSDFYKIFRE